MCELDDVQRDSKNGRMKTFFSRQSKMFVPKQSITLVSISLLVAKLSSIFQAWKLLIFEKIYGMPITAQDLLHLARALPTKQQIRDRIMCKARETTRYSNHGLIVFSTSVVIGL